MNCQNKISYVIRQGDTLYNIAAHYGTTVENILSNNRHLNIYNLRIGELITFCIDKDIADINNMHQNDDVEANDISDNEADNEYVITLPELDLNNDMRMLWSQKIFWTQKLIISIADGLGDISIVNKRLLKTPKDMSSLFRNYYGSTTAGNMEQILSNHLRITFELINAIKEKNIQALSETNNRWYANADELSNLLSSINPFYTFEELQGMLHNQLDLIKQGINMRVDGNFTGDIETSDIIEQQALALADMLSNGMVNQFPDAFF